MFVLDLKNLTYWGYNFGQTFGLANTSQHIWENDFPMEECFFDKAGFSGKLSRGSKIAILSPGLRKNTKDVIEDRSIIDFVMDHIDKGSSDILNEIFYQLKKDTDRNDFLSYDASAVVIEVDPKVIVEV